MLADTHYFLKFCKAFSAVCGNDNANFRHHPRGRRWRGYLSAAATGTSITSTAAAAAGEGIVPLHDSFIVRASYEDGLRGSMAAAFREVCGAEPVINRK